MALSSIGSDFAVRGHLSCETMDLPASTVKNAGVSATADIAVTKCRQLIACTYKSDNETDIIDIDIPLYIATGTSTIRSVRASCLTAPTSIGEYITIDVKVGSDSVALASILNSTITITTSDVDMQVKSGSLATTSMSNEDVLVASITVDGDDSGVGARGLIVIVEIDTAAN